MSRRTLGLGLVTVGGLVALVGLIGLLTAGGGAREEAAGPTTTTVEPGTKTTTVLPTTTSVPTTTTTTLAPTTTAAVDAFAEIEAFVTEFAAAIDRRDVDFLFDSLHPSVLESHDEDLCRSFIEDEILLIENYRLTGEVAGPDRQTIGSFEVEGYAAPVAFTFQGQDFEAEAGFALVDGEVTWFTECR